MNTYFIETFGCQMNKTDSSLIKNQLEKAGYVSAPAETASIIVFNTCAVRGHAERRAIARISEAKALAEKRGQIVITAGCIAQSKGPQLVAEGITDIAAGPYESPAIVELIKKYKDNGTSLFISQQKEDFQERIHPSLPLINYDKPWQQWITITHGCENYCTYCIVPYVRGPLHSFSSKLIIEYLLKIADTGVSEIMLLGQNVNQYGQDTNDIPFYKLLDRCARIDSFKKIGFLTSHPKDFSNDLVQVIKDHTNIAKSIHLPLQSGSDKILKKMNRQYTFSHYMNIINELEKIGKYAISTDLIVGFPGETESDYSETLDAVKKIQYDEAFMYAYSPREGTPGAEMKDQLDSTVKKERLSELISIQRNITVSKLKNQIGTETFVIPEGKSRKSENEITGRTMFNHPVVFEAPPSVIGSFQKIMITGINGATLKGGLQGNR